jgi:hypothetical protein
MRFIAILLSLVAAVASAQQPNSPASQPEPTPPPVAPAPSEPPPPPSPSTDTPTPGATGPAEPAGKRALRYSRFSAGPGGPLVAFTEVISGIVSGAMLGHTYDREEEQDNDKASNAYTGAMVGGLLLGTAATLYQYYIPIERNESFLAAGGASTAFIAGLAIASSSDMSSRGRALFSFATTQAGALSVLALTQSEGDVSTGDSALVGMVSLYAFTLTGLTQLLVDEEDSGEGDYTATFVAPAVGMALGSLFAVPLEVDSRRILKLTLVPLGVGMTMLWLGSSLADGATVPLTAMAGIVTSFALTLLLTSDPGVPTEKDPLRRSDFQAMPVPVVLAAGLDNSSIAAGPGLFMRF